MHHRTGPTTEKSSTTAKKVIYIHNISFIAHCKFGTGVQSKLRDKITFIQKNNNKGKTCPQTKKLLTQCGPVFFPLYLSHIINSK
jgi:hypothetical protein